MSACLWNDIDAALVAAVTADMTPAGDYEDHIVQTVLVGDTVNPDHHELPLVLIRGAEAQYGENIIRGDAVYLDGIVYSYDLIAITRTEPDNDDTVTAVTLRAKAAGNELLRRLRECVRNRPALGISAPATDGETIDHVRFAGGRGGTTGLVQVIGFGGVNGGYEVTVQLSIEVAAML